MKSVFYAVGPSSITLDTFTGHPKCIFNITAALLLKRNAMQTWKFWAETCTGVAGQQGLLEDATTAQRTLENERNY